METDKGSAPGTSSERKYYIDSTFLTPARERVEMVSPLKDGMGELTIRRCMGVEE